MREKQPYQNFKPFVLRSPVFPVNFIGSILSDRNIAEDQLLDICRQPVVSEALFLASPDLHSQLQERLNGKLTDPKKVKKLHYALMRYILRMTTRPTPFGLFAGFNVGEWGNETRVELEPIEKYTRHTRLDLNYLCALAMDLAKFPPIKERLKFYPNSSIYPVGKQLRYVEYRYRNAKRTHHIVAVDHTEYLQRVLEAAGKAAYLKDLASLLVDDEITQEEAREYIEELVNSQVLVSELEPAITGPEFLTQIVDILDRICTPNTPPSTENTPSEDIENIKTIISYIRNAEQLLNEIDSKQIGTTLPYYNRIAEGLKPLNTGFELKYLFQTDMVKPGRACTLSSEILNDIWEGMEMLIKFSGKPAVTNLTQFRDAFSERYETKEISLLKVMDTEIGLGYLQNNNAGDLSPLVDDLAIPSVGAQSQDIKWTPMQSFLFDKYTKALKSQSYTMELTEKEMERFNSTWDDLPDTFYTMVQITNDKNDKNESQTGEPPKPKIILSSFGGSSGGNLLGRFCHADPATDAYTKLITQQEEEMNPDIILAEIVHLPESRVGNVILRPVLRPYEIPYLAKSAVSEEFQIKLEDLMVSVKGNRIVLRSKRLNKEIRPHLTNAHNYSYNALPVYHFLADIQTQNSKGGAGFSMGSLAKEYEFSPRVVYKNIIFSPATWNIKKDDIEPLTKINDDNELINATNEWRKKHRMPEEVLLADHDNKLFINLENAMCIRTLFSVVQNRLVFELEEFIFDPEHAIVKSEDGVFTNEFIFTFYNTEKNKTQGEPQPESKI